jgi:hypothetical protein
MSYTLSLYAVSIDQLRRTLGGGDDQLLESIQAHQPREWSRRESEELASTGEVVQQLVKCGRVTASVPAPEVGYALEMLCAEIGGRIESSEFDGISRIYLERIARKLKWAAKLFGPRMPVDVPASQGFPVVGHMTHPEIVAAMESLDESKCDQSEDDVALGCVALVDALSYARESGHDLIAFYY